MDGELTREEQIEKLKQIKNTKMDPYRLYICDGISKVRTYQCTDFDSFITQDALRLVVDADRIEAFKSKYSDRCEGRLEVYPVTVGDYGTEYYEIATMLNRLNNIKYAKRVHVASELFKRLVQSMQKSAENDVSNQSESYVMDGEDRKPNF